MASLNINRTSYDLPIHQLGILWLPHTSTGCLMTSPYINRTSYNLQKHPHAVLWPTQTSAGCLMTLLNMKRKWAENSMGLQWEIIYQPSWSVSQFTEGFLVDWTFWWLCVLLCFALRFPEYDQAVRWRCAGFSLGVWWFNDTQMESIWLDKREVRPWAKFTFLFCLFCCWLGSWSQWCSSCWRRSHRTSHITMVCCHSYKICPVVVRAMLQKRWQPGLATMLYQVQKQTRQDSVRQYHTLQDSTMPHNMFC